MRFELYTEKTVAQTLIAVHDRLHVKPTAKRPAMDGWVTKDGEFTLSVSSKISGKFNRTTRLWAKAQRKDGITVIEGHVPNGLSRETQAILFGVLLVLALVIILNGSGVLALVVIALSAIFYIPLTGDHHNSTLLMNEMQRVLKAKDTPPQKKTKRK